MKRIVYLVIVLLYKIPGWILKIKKYVNNIDKISFEKRYQLLIEIITLINKKSRVNVHCYGIENIPEEQGHLIAPNHQGMFDSLVILETHKQPLKIILKKELLDVVVLRDVIKMVEFVGIDRSNLRASMKVIKQATVDMKNNINYLIFPEGTRSKNKNELLEFKGGTFKSVIDAKKPIVPVALIDCYKVFDDNNIKRTDIQIHYLKPLYYEDYAGLNSTEVANLVQKRIEECIQKYQKINEE